MNCCCHLILSFLPSPSIVFRPPSALAQALGRAIQIGNRLKAPASRKKEQLQGEGSDQEWTRGLSRFEMRQKREQELAKMNPQERARVVEGFALLDDLERLLD